MSCRDDLKDFYAFYAFYDFYDFYDVPLTARSGLSLAKGSLLTIISTGGLATSRGGKKHPQGPSGQAISAWPPLARPGCERPL